MDIFVICDKKFDNNFYLYIDYQVFSFGDW